MTKERYRLTGSGIKCDVVAIRIKCLNIVDKKSSVSSFLHTHHLVPRLKHRWFIIHVLHPNLHQQPHMLVSNYTHTHPLNGPLSRTTQVSWYQKGRTNLDFTEARDSERQWHQLGHMHVCISLQTDNHASTPPLSFLQAGCPSCHANNSVKALKAQSKQFIQHQSRK